jgi:hypothetical protein
MADYPRAADLLEQLVITVQHMAACYLRGMPQSLGAAAATNSSTRNHVLAAAAAINSTWLQVLAAAAAAVLFACTSCLLMVARAADLLEQLVAGAVHVHICKTAAAAI